MTAVAFHFGMADPLGYACRLLRKASRAGAKVVVHGSSGALNRLDQALWTFDPLEFLPHWRGSRVSGVAPRLAGTPLVLVDELAGAAATYPVLLNLNDAVPEGFDAFERVIEIVGGREEARALARQRWRDYARHGAAIERHEVTG